MALRVKSSDSQEPLAEKIRDARFAVDLTQAELAAHFGVSARTVQYWEAGGTPLPKHRRIVREWIAFVEGEESA